MRKSPVKAVTSTATIEAGKTASSFALTDDMKKLLSAMSKEHSKGTVTVGSEMLKSDYGRLRTGILTLDLCLRGGIRKSRGAMLYGESSSGKTTLSLMLVARAQRENPTKVVVWVDVETTMEVDYAATLGVDLDRFFVVQPDSGEEAVDQYIAFLENEQVCMVVLDSIAFLTPTKEINASASDALMGVHARLIGGLLRRATITLLRQRKKGHFPIALYINQYRTNLGQLMGDNRVLPGGKALKYAVSQGIEIKCKEHKAGGKSATGSKLESDEQNGTVLFNEHIFTIGKDKTGGRIKEGVFKLIRDESMGMRPGYIDQTRSIINYAKAIGIHSGAAAHQKLEGFCNYAGEENLREMLYKDPDLQERICTHIVNHYINKWDAKK